MRCKFFILLFTLFTLPVLGQQTVLVKQLEGQRKRILLEIETTSRLLTENKKTTSNALNRLNLLTQQITSRKSVIQLLNQEVKTIENNILSKERQIKDLEIELQRKKENYADAVKQMYVNKNKQNHLLFILSAKDFSQSFRRTLYLKEYSGWKVKEAESIREKQNQLNEQKNRLEKDRENKLALLDERKKEENKLAKEESVRKAEVDDLRKNQKQLSKTIAEKKKQADALNKQIEKIIAEEVAKSKKDTKSGNRVASTQGGYAMTKEEQTLSTNFAGNKGKLPFPLQGNYRIVARFGVHQHKELKNVVTNNNGIDIETTPGNEARSVFDGVVSRIFTLPGYNNSIIVRHGNYLTLYSYIDQVYVKQGDKVKTGQKLGKIYTDPEKGNSTVLHFELWKEQSKQDPLPWLNR
ncbi:peptidoglycan DD-metalloendopeptidase family protein [Bacteroidales bacterium OttesenSCG-928-A17]|nr:peptidoglycan DD-metalloendopeptidase family protein [Bacteroidales bacterium OttesenSCG-928-A17]